MKKQTFLLRSLVLVTFLALTMHCRAAIPRQEHPRPDLDEFYARYEGLVSALLDNPDMFGFCYTQLTDVEQEHNGRYYYDRRPKFDLKRLHAATSRKAAYEANGPAAPAPQPLRKTEWKVLVGARADGELCAPYRYASAQPPETWNTESFDDSSWSLDRALFRARGAMEV
jgi:hypothetical protein